MDNQTFSNNRFDKKDQLLEINPMALRLSGQSSARAFDEHPLRHFPAFMARRPADPHQKVQTLEHPEQSEFIFSSRFHTEQATERLKASQAANLLILSHDMCLRIVHLQNLWWRRTGSNRRPPACKAGALPAELRPRKGMGIWWAWEDLNLRPHAYQARALTN